MTATRAQREGATEEEARQEAKDPTVATTMLAIKAVAAGKLHRATGRINPVIGPEHNQAMEGDEQTTEEATRAIATRLQPQEIIEAKLLVNK